MKELPYFKFFPAEWIKGDITLCSMQAQGLFINICTFYWLKGCDMSLTSVQHRFNGCSDVLDELINKEILSVSDGEISINYLDEQFEQFAELSEKKSRAGKASAKKRKGNKRSTPVKHVVNKEDKDKDKDKEKIPAFEDFKNFAIEKKPLVGIAALKLKYESWVENDWKDGHGNKIINWKSKLLNTLPFIDERQKGANMAEGPPENFGVRSSTSVPMPEHLKKKLGKIGTEK